jgi:hypothetical protein
MTDSSDPFDDQADAAAAEAAWLITTRAQVRALPSRETADIPAMAVLNRKLEDAALRAGCAHLTAPCPVHWVARQPELVYCDSCYTELEQKFRRAYFAAPVCDVCKRRGRIHGMTYTIGAFIIHAGVCDRCAGGAPPRPS